MPVIYKFNVPTQALGARQIPADVLHNIFQIGTYDSPDPMFPILASQVCKQWHDVALMTPTLWTTISVSPNKAFHTKDDDLYDLEFPLVQMSIARSGVLPLDVRLDLRRRTSNVDMLDPANIPFELFSSLLPHAHRFREVSLVANTWPSMLFVLSELSHASMPLLETWNMEYAASQPFNDEFWPRALRQSVLAPSLPRLRNMSFVGTHLLWSQCSPTTLTSLTLSHMARDVRLTHGEMCRLLRANAGTLERLEIQGGAPVHFDVVGELDIVTLPALKALTLGYTEPLETIALVLSINAPQLRTLVLADLNTVHFAEEDSDATPLFDALINYMPLPLHAIEHLILQNIVFNAPEDGIDVYRLETFIGRTMDPRLLVPVRVLMAFSSLKTLDVDRPDAALLHALNMGIPNRAAAAATKCSGLPPQTLPAATVTRFSLTHADPNQLASFLGQRSCLMDYAEQLAVRPWASMTVGCHGATLLLGEVCAVEGWRLDGLADEVFVVDENVAYEDDDDDSSDDDDDMDSTSDLDDRMDF
ncbi:hypothetical protein PLICRDRAFT_279699 [Plicaturopsis crispa FD-325 SS-3]|nr:hypothetical protein PLICRDRAFT_279699 [Plicaturopsis crispa FD-325 SS-3]